MLRLERRHRNTAIQVHRWASYAWREAMLYLGVDWSEREQVVCICNHNGARLSQLSCAQTLAGFQRLQREARKKKE
jgi:hypothetical protein